MVMLHIKLNGIMNAATLFQIFCPHTSPTLGIGSIGQESTFSEHGHVAYQIKGNHEMQQHGRNMVESVQISLFFIEQTTEN